MDFENTSQPIQQFSPSPASPAGASAKKGGGWKIFWGIITGLSVLANFGFFIILIGMVILFAAGGTERKFIEEVVKEGPRTARIAIISIDGIIDDRQADNVYRQLKAAGEDKRIKGLIVRVNSPGGDVFASEEIYRQLELTKGKKPLVVSMGGVAASGGYYIACPGDAILASPGTITGSIGVVTGKPDLSGFYDKIGITHETIKRGAHADIRSIMRPASEEEMRLIGKMVEEYYGDFVSKVTTWRKLDADSINAIGAGRVWTGRQALERGLVDSYGGIWEAVELARQKARIDRDERVEFVILPEYKIAILPAFGAPSLEAQLTSLFDGAENWGYYFKQPFTLKIE